MVLKRFAPVQAFRTILQAAVPWPSCAVSGRELPVRTLGSPPWWV